MPARNGRFLTLILLAVVALAQAGPVPAHSQSEQTPPAPRSADAAFQGEQRVPDSPAPSEQRTVLTLELGTRLPDGSIEAAGHLADAEEGPLPGATVELSAIGVASEYRVSSAVPASATLATIGFRANVPGACCGPVEVVLYAVDYREADGPNRVLNGDFAARLRGWGSVAGPTALKASDLGAGHMVHVSATAGETAQVETMRFPVTPGAPFAATFTARMPPDSALTGFFGVFFFGSGISGAVVGGRGVGVATTEGELVVTTTDEAGRFTATLVGLPSAPLAVRARYPGDSDHTSALAEVRLRDAAAPTSSERPVPTSPFGVISGGHQGLIPELEALGAKWFRNNVGWQNVEGPEGQYDWSGPDGMMAAAEAANIEWVANLGSYAGGEPPGRANPLYASAGPEAKLAAYERFVREAARRYRGRVRYWQIENEVALRKYWAAPLEDYLPVLRTAYDAIKGEDPGAQVVLAGFADLTPRNQVPLLLNGGRDYFDIVDMHVYRPAEQMAEAVAIYREEMRRLAINKPLWMTETGGPHPCIVSSRTQVAPPPSVQQAEVVKRYSVALAAGVSPVFWLEVVGHPEDLLWPCPTRAEAEQIRSDWPLWGHMALIRLFEPQPRPAFSTYQLMAQRLEGFSGVESLDVGAGVWAYRFRKPGGDVFVLWADRDTTVRLPGLDSPATSTDVNGAESPADPARLRVGAMPIFVERRR